MDQIVLIGLIKKPRDAYGGNGFQILRVAANILNNQSRTADKEWSPRLEIGRGANSSSPLITKCYTGSRNWTDSLEQPGQLP
jgi:hypothetical protein